MKHVITILIAAGVMLAALRPAPAESAEKRDLVVAVFMSATGMVSDSQQFEYAKAFFGTFGEKFGYNVKVMRFTDRGDMVRNFIDGNLDIASFSPEDFAMALEGGAKIRPLITVAHNGKTSMETCFWHRKDLKIESAQDMVGRKMVYMEGLDYMYFILIRSILQKHGVDLPLWKVFPKAFKTSGGTSPLLALINGDGDVMPGFTMVEVMLNYAGTDLKKKLAASLREDGDFDWAVMAAGGTVTDEEYQTMRKNMAEYLKNMKTYEEDNLVLHSMNRFMKQMEVNTVPADEDHYMKEYQMYLKSKETGWADEGKYLAKLLMGAAPGRTISLEPTPETCHRLYAPDDPETPAFCK